jgi:hypothetical protein
MSHNEISFISKLGEKVKKIETEVMEIEALGKIFTACIAINRTINEIRLDDKEQISLLWVYKSNKRIDQIVRENRSFVLVLAHEEPPAGAIRMQLKSEDYKLFFLPNVKAQQLD